MTKHIDFDEATGDLRVTYTNFDDKESSSNLTRVEIKEEDFLKIRETLQRIGIYSAKDKVLWQSAHILHKKGYYYIVHFKELFALDGRRVDFNDEDSSRLKVIVGLLLKWGLVSVPDQKTEAELRSMVKDGADLPVRLRVIPFSRRRDFNLKSKYPIGKTIEE